MIDFIQITKILCYIFAAIDTILSALEKRKDNYEKANFWLIWAVFLIILARI